MKRRLRRIETVQAGNARVKIYRRTRSVAGHNYATFEVCDYTSGHRKLRSFADHQAALQEAHRLAKLLARGDAVAASISGREAASFGRCLELLKRTGDAPELACARYAEASEVLGNGNLLAPAARFYMERHPTRLPSVTLAQAAAEMIQLRKQAEASPYYLIDLRCRLGKFTRAVAGHPASVTSADCQKYLDSLAGASSSKNAHRAAIWRLFAHCESRGYIPRGANPVTACERFRGNPAATVSVWTPEEMAKLLSAASADFLPALAIGGFAGLRTSEILALDWRDVRLAERSIRVTHRKARCAGTRLAPIPENLSQWLTPLAKAVGPVWPTGQNRRARDKAIAAAQNAAAEGAGLLPWRHNALRHSFCTYRVAATQNVAQTALEAGNSAHTIFAHYRALATEAEGKAWFALAPPQTSSKRLRIVAPIALTPPCSHRAVSAAKATKGEARPMRDADPLQDA
jgi:integrase